MSDESQQPTSPKHDPKLCQACGERPATVHLTKVTDDLVSVEHLCENCAAEKGVESPAPPANFPLSDFLAQMGGGEAGAAKGAPPEADSSAECGYCGLTYAKFRETGRLGCPHCWVTFETQLRGLVRRVHGSAHHAGKVYLPQDPTAADRVRRLESLRERLDRAVDSEDFERAAEIRDAIQTLEGR
jgi:protein arginine kinase activator